MSLGSGFAVAVAQAGSYSSDLTPSLGTSICCTCSPKKQTKKKPKPKTKSQNGSGETNRGDAGKTVEYKVLGYLVSFRSHRSPAAYIVKFCRVIALYSKSSLTMP